MVMGACSDNESKKIGIRENSLFHSLLNSVGAYDIELEDHGPKTFHKSLMDSNLPIHT